MRVGRTPVHRRCTVALAATPRRRHASFPRAPILLFFFVARSLSRLYIFQLSGPAGREVCQMILVSCVKRTFYDCARGEDRRMADRGFPFFLSGP